MKANRIPVYNVYDSLERGLPFAFHLLETKTKYDTTKHHRHSYYEIFFFIKGGGIHDMDFEEHTVRSSSLHFVSPGQVHLLRRSLKSEGYVILFSREFYHLGSNSEDILYELPFLNNNTRRPIVNIPSLQVSYFVSLFENIRNEYVNGNADSDQVLRSYLKILLLKAKSLFKDEVFVKEEPGPSESTTRKFKKLVEQYFIEKHKVHEYATMLNISPGHLNDIVKKTFGTPAGELVHERLLLEIKRLLFHSDLTVAEIAIQLHFEDHSYFTRFFRRRQGVSPTEYRELIREKYQ